MTLAEITAKLNELLGLKEKVTALESSSATSAQLTAEVEARKKVESDLAAAQAELAKIKAGAPPVKEGDTEEASVTDAIKALENAITVLKGIAGQGAADADTETKAEDGADESDDMEAKKAATAKDWRKVTAIRTAQFARKQAFVAKKAQAKTDKLVTEKVTAQIAALGIPAPLALNKDGKNPIRAEKPDGRKRAHRLVATGFSEQPAVASLNLALGRSARN